MILAGEIESVGADGSRFKPGDEVFGMGGFTSAVVVRRHPTTVGRNSADYGARPTFYTQEHVLLLKNLMQEGKYRAVIDRCYPLERVVDAASIVETRQKTGDVVLTV